VGGTRQRPFDGIQLEPRKLPKNAATPTTTVLVLSQGSGARCVGRAFVCKRQPFYKFHCYQGFGVAISVASAGGVPSGVGDGIAVGWDEIAVGGMPRI